MNTTTGTDWARYVGLPWEELGRTAEGLDCWGLFRWIIGVELGVWLPDMSTVYDNTEDYENMEREINAAKVEWVEVDENDIRPFDLIHLRIVGRHVHVGLVTGYWHMLHIEDGESSVWEPFDGMKWHHRVLGFYRHECYASLAANRIGH